MTNNFRALCADLIEAVLSDDSHIDCTEIARRARAALSDEPAVPEGREPAAVTGQPSDWEIMGLMPQQMHEDLAYAARAMANEAGIDNRNVRGSMRTALNRHAVDLARAVLARWGRPAPAPPADGEVAELVAWLQEEADDYECIGCEDSVARCTRAAELLQRQVLVPVSISERLPGPEDCDAEGRCWFGTPGCTVWGASWVLRKRSHQRNGITSWLPGHALPLPEVGE